MPNLTKDKMEKILTFENVKYFYQTKNDEIFALNNISFDIEKEQFVSLVGPSGCGKTTILSLSSSLLKPSSGKIKLDGDEKIDSKKIGYMFQRDHLFEWRSVWKNITLGLEIRKPDDKEKKLAKAEELLKKYDLFSFKDQKPRSLSGGMRQRVALIRTLALEPQLLLLDEPFSGLDPVSVDELENAILELKNEGKTIIFSSHIMNHVEKLCDDILIIDHGKSMLYGKLADVLSNYTINGNKVNSLNDIFIDKVGDDNE